MLGDQLLHPARRRMEPHLQRVERQAALDGNRQLAVEDEVLGVQPLEQPHHIREVAAERLAGLGKQHDATVALDREAAKAVPLWLELPALTARKRSDEQRLHRRERHLRY